MPKPRQLYSLYSRSVPLVSGKSVIMYYYRTYDEEGKLHSFATGKRKKTEALAFVQVRLRAGKLIPAKKIVSTIKEYSQDFWDFDGKRVQSALLRKRLTPAYCASQRNILKNHWYEPFGDWRIDQLTVKHIEALITEKSETLSSKMVNHITLAMRAVFDEAVRLGDLETNPFDRVKLVQVRKVDRGVLSPEEGFKVLAKPSYFRSPLFWALNFVSATTGARAGELRGLKVKNVHKDRIEIAAVIRAKVGYVEDTKTGKFRWIPIAARTARVLADLCKDRKPDDFVFEGVTEQQTSESISEALEASGIMTNKERLARGVDFHSWRHWFNSMIRGKASDVALRSATGHSSEAMTENYFHQLETHLTEVRGAQEKAFDALK